MAELGSTPSRSDEGGKHRREWGEGGSLVPTYTCLRRPVFQSSQFSAGETEAAEAEKELLRKINAASATRRGQQPEFPRGS